MRCDWICCRQKMEKVKIFCIQVPQFWWNLISLLSIFIASLVINFKLHLNFVFVICQCFALPTCGYVDLCFQGSYFGASSLIPSHPPNLLILSADRRYLRPRRVIVIVPGERMFWHSDLPPKKCAVTDHRLPSIMFLNRRQLEKFSMELEQPSMLVGQTSFQVRGISYKSGTNMTKHFWPTK